MALDISDMVPGVVRLDVAVRRYLPDEFDDQIRDGLMPCSSSPARWAPDAHGYFESVAPNPDVYDVSRSPGLSRSGNKQGLLQSGWPARRENRTMRGKTRNTYDLDVAFPVVERVPDFSAEAVFLRDLLRGRIGDVDGD